MKKKILSLLLVGIMCLSMVACAGEEKVQEPTQEELLESAIEINGDDLRAAVNENSARAELDYEGKVVVLTSVVRSIGSTYVDVSHELYNGYPLNSISVYLPKEVLAELNKGDTITVMGTLEGIVSFPKIKDATIITE